MSIDVHPNAQDYYDRMTLESAVAIAKEVIAEWSYDEDPHGYCHRRAVLARLVEAVGWMDRPDELTKEEAARYAAWARLRAPVPPEGLKVEIPLTCGPHRGPEGPNEDLSMCRTCGSPTYALLPDGETYGDHLPDCSLPRRHESYCQPGGAGHQAAPKIRGYWPDTP